MPEKLQVQSCLKGECYCGRGLFQSDADLRHVNQIARSVGLWLNTQLEVGERPKPDWLTKDNVTMTRDQMQTYLDDGIFPELFDHWDDEAEHVLQIMLAAVAMQFGATVSRRRHARLVSLYKGNLSSRTQMDEFKHALWNYEDGEPWKWFDVGCDLDMFLRKVTYHVKL